MSARASECPTSATMTTLYDEAKAQFERGNFSAAEPLFRRQTCEEPSNSQAHYNLGVTLTKLDRYEEAIACYRRAIELNPHFDFAYTNLGFCLNALNLIPQARQAFALARQLAPDNPVPRLNEGMAALALGDYAEGWDGFAARWQIPAYAKFHKKYDQPEWSGAAMKDRTICVYAEQGFGDFFQMARYLPLLAAQGATVIVETPPALTRLVQRMPCVARAITKGDAPPAFDTYAAMMDLPRAFGTRLDSIPSATPYLFADNQGIDRFTQLLPTSGKKRVGLAWAGRPSHENDRHRSLSLAQLMPLLNQPNIEWISLQKNVADADRPLLRASGLRDWGNGFNDFADTADAIATLDLVISVDSAVAHLAGAMGKPVWILLPFYADWRWLMHRADSPWYPTARLWRQPRRGDWDCVLAGVADELKKD